MTMPRIIVTTDPPQLPNDGSVVLDELVQSVHLSTGHAAAQLVERLAWAISDAEDAERKRAAPAPRATRRPARRGALQGTRARQAVRA
jgi:hypothetical protein